MTAENTATAVGTETIEGAKELARVFRAKDMPLYLHSAPGLGKSDVMRQLAAEDNSGFKDIRIGTMLPEDLTGIPIPDLEKRLAVWLRAEFWPNEERDGKRGIIAFDELSDAPRNMQSCIYRVILDREIGDYKLPANWWPVAAGNRREDRAAAQTLSTALANRFSHIHIRADVDCWAAWANLHNIDPMLIGFMKFRPALLHDMSGSDMLAFPTPRSWAKASLVFNESPALRFKLLRATVGEGAALEVETFFKVLTLPDFDEIIKRPDTAMIPDEPGSRYALTSLLSRKMTLENFPQIYKYIMREDFGADYATVVVLDATKRDSGLCDSKTFTSWALKNKNLRL